MFLLRSVVLLFKASFYELLERKHILTILRYILPYTKVMCISNERMFKINCICIASLFKNSDTIGRVTFTWYA